MGKHTCSVWAKCAYSSHFHSQCHMRIQAGSVSRRRRRKKEEDRTVFFLSFLLSKVKVMKWPIDFVKGPSREIHVLVSELASHWLHAWWWLDCCGFGCIQVSLFLPPLSFPARRTFYIDRICKQSRTSKSTDGSIGGWLHQASSILHKVGLHNLAGALPEPCGHTLSRHVILVTF